MKRRTFFGTAAALGVGSMFLNGNLSAQDKPEAESDSKVLFKLGLASYTCRQFDRAKTIAMSKRAGLLKIAFKDIHLPLNSTEEQCAAAAAECKAAGINLYGAGVVNMPNEKEIENAFRYAKAAGLDTIIATPAVDKLPVVEKFVKETGIRIAIHNHGPGDNRYPTPESIYDKIKDFDERIGICIDVGHTLRIGVDPSEAIRKYAARIHDVHLKDETEATAKGNTCICGRGVLDLVSVLNAMIDIKYDKVASFEYEADAGDPLPGVMESVGYIRGLLKMLG